MGRRRGNGPPGLLGRVRWGNVGRLAALLATGLLIAAGPRSCERRAPALVPDTPSIRPAPPRAGAQPPAIARTEARSDRPPRRVRRHRGGHPRRRHRRQRPHQAAPSARTVPAPPVAAPSRPRYIAPRIHSAPRPVHASAPEFL